MLLSIFSACTIGDAFSARLDNDGILVIVEFFFLYGSQVFRYKKSVFRILLHHSVGTDSSSGVGALFTPIAASVKCKISNSASCTSCHIDSSLRCIHHYVLSNIAISEMRSWQALVLIIKLMMHLKISLLRHHTFNSRSYLIDV